MLLPRNGALINYIYFQPRFEISLFDSFLILYIINKMISINLIRTSIDQNPFDITVMVYVVEIFLISRIIVEIVWRVQH